MTETQQIAIECFEDDCHNFIKKNDKKDTHFIECNESYLKLMDSISHILQGSLITRKNLTILSKDDLPLI